MMRYLLVLCVVITASTTPPIWADGLGNRTIDEVFDLPLITGTATNCDSTPTVSVYEGNEAVPTIRNAVLMTQRTAAGRYYYRETLSAVNGYEVGKTYTVVYACTQGSAKEAADEFQVVASTVAVASIANDAITAATIATDAIGASEVAPAAITSSEAPNLDVAVSTRSTLTDAAVWTYSAGGGRTLTGFSTTLALSVWDVLQTNVATANSMGLKLKTMRP